MMQPKIIERLERKFERLPSHFIDTNILFEALKDTKLGNQCSDYLNRVGYKYKGILSSSVIGEFFLLIFRDIETDEERVELFNFINRLIIKRKIRFSSIKHESNEITDRIKKLDSRIEDMDAIHLANCLQDQGNVFVTLDEKLIGNRTLENELKIKILHPKQL